MTGHRTAKLVLRALLGLALFVPSVLAPLPAVAQPAGPFIEFTPTSSLTISPGGSFSVTAGNFACEDTVTVVLVSASDPNKVTTLESVSRCGPFGPSFNLSTGVPVDTYTAQASDQHGNTATSHGTLTIASRGGTVGATAGCPTFDPIPGTLVELFSGADLVARTTSGAGGTYAITGLAPNSTYFVRYSRGSLECSSTVTTDIEATPTVSTACPNPGHASWDDPLTYSGAPVQFAICKANQSFWVKVAITPGSTFALSLSGGGPKTRVELFRDLRKEGDLLLAKRLDPSVDLRQLTASLPGVGGTDWDSNDWDSNDWDSNPWDSNDWDSNDWDSNPWDSNDWDSNPCTGTTGCTNTTGNDGAIYSAAEQRALLAASKHGQITRNTWDNTGDFYIRVFNQDASFDPSRILSLSASAGSVCGTGNVNKTASSFGVVGNPSTVILTNTARIKAVNGLPLTDPSNVTRRTAYLSTLNAFNTFVNGTATGIIDFANDPGLGQDYKQWDLEPSCVPAANVVSEAIHDLLAKYRAQDPALKYVTIAAGHTAIPYRLSPDHAEIQKEKRFNPGLLDQSESAATLGSSYVMSDNYYISFTPISHLDAEINLPEANLAVGRLVETSEDIRAVLNAFLANKGLLTPATALATGYTFVKDLAKFESSEFSKSGLTTETGAKDALHPDGVLISDTWTMPDLKDKIFATGARYDIMAFNWHATTNAAVAADYTCTPLPDCGPHPTVLTSGDLAAAAPNVRNSLVMSIGCHFGYNLLNPDVIGNAQGKPVTPVRDFNQVLASQGAMVLANTGYGYGDTEFMGYGERLLGIFTQELEYSDYGASVPVGLALTRAKRNYVGGAATLTGVDKKTVEQLTFYGPPMWSIALRNRATRPTPNPLPPFTPTIRGGGLSAGDVAPPYELQQFELGDGNNEYFAVKGGTIADNGGTETLPFRAVQPFKGFNAANAAAGALRGVALLTGSYTDLPSFFPLTNSPATEEPGGQQTPSSSHGLTPFMPLGMNQLIDQSLALMPAQWTGDRLTGTARQYNDNSSTSQGLQVRLYYSSVNSGTKAVAGPTSINDVALTRSTTNGTLVHVDATISGANIAGVSDVLVTYTAIGTNSLHGTWTTCNLISGRSGGVGVTASCPNAHITSIFDDETTFLRHYSADIDTAGTGAGQTDVRALIQAVSGTGLVSVAVNNGQYYQVNDKPTISLPKQATVLTLTPPTSPSEYDHSATFSATVKSNGLPAAGQVVFTVGSQRNTVQTASDGSATTKMVIEELPGSAGGDSRNYPLTAAFLETPTLLPSAAAADFIVTKKPTSVVFGATPFLVTLTDDENHRLRDETVFFDVSGNGVSQTLAAQTGVDGVAQLRGLTVPAGTYTLTAYFLGKIPHASGAFGTLVDERYSASSITTSVVFDPTPPSCDLTNVGIDGHGQTFIEVTVQDANSGLVSVSTTELVNATVSIPIFTNGTQGPQIVRATKIDQTQGAQLGLEVVNAAGKVTDCDPVSVVLDSRGVHRSLTIKNVKPTEHFVVIYNGEPGLRAIQVKVNHHTWQVRDLRAGEVRTLDVAQALSSNSANTVTLKAEGPPNGSAQVLISDMAPRSAVVRHAQPERSTPVDDRDNLEQLAE